MRGVPIRYSIRNLFRRPGRTTLTVAGLSLVVALVVFLAAFGRSIAAAVRITGDPENLVVVSKKAQTMELSSIKPTELDQMKNALVDRLQADADGEPLYSKEVFRFEQIVLGDDEQKRRAKLHGISPALAPTMLAGFRLLEGALPEPGSSEIMIGRRAAEDMGVSADLLEVDDSVTIGDELFTIVGLFEAHGSLVEHWIVTDVEDLKRAIMRSDYSFARMKVKAGVDIEALANEITLDERYSVRVLPETEYFADFAEGFSHLQQFAVLLAIVLGVGGVLTGMNTMHNAVSGRIREIGVLRVLGFSKGQVGVTFLIEVLLLCSLAGVIGCAIGWFADGLPMRLPFAAAFPVAVDGISLAIGFATALLMGLLGLAFPMSRALRASAVDAVRAVG